MKKNIKWIVFVVCLLFFIFISINILDNKSLIIDEVIYNWIDTFFISDDMTVFMKFITWFGSTIGIIIIGIISLFFIRNKKINISLTLCLILGTTINNVIKPIFARVRPDIYPLVFEDTYSFPSGHSMMSMILYGYLIYLMYKYIKNKRVKWLLIIMLSILIFCIGFTRIYLGVHYFSDVIGGFVLGIAYLILYIDISKKIIKKI